MSALVQQTEDWLALRRTKIGASDAPVIMGVSPWSTPYSLWCEKLGLSEGRSQTEAMRRGIVGEEEARLCFIQKTGIYVCPEVVFHADHEFMMASLDGISDDGLTVVEIKRPGNEDHDMALSGRVPEKYYPQLQHQLACCNLDMVYYFSYRSDDDNVLIKVDRDDEYIKEMIEREREFFAFMNDVISPPLTERDYIIQGDEEWKETASAWKLISEQLKDLETKEKNLRNKLISLSQGKNSKGSGIRITKVVRKGCVDYSRITEIQNINVEDYRKESSVSWRITAA